MLETPSEASTCPKHEPLAAEGGGGASFITHAVRARRPFHSGHAVIAWPPLEDRHLAWVTECGILLADARDMHLVAVSGRDRPDLRLELGPRPFEAVVGVA